MEDYSLTKPTIAELENLKKREICDIVVKKNKMSTASSCRGVPKERQIWN